MKEDESSNQVLLESAYSLIMTNYIKPSEFSLLVAPKNPALLIDELSDEELIDLLQMLAIGIHMFGTTAETKRGIKISQDKSDGEIQEKIWSFHFKIYR
jgi:hypothetical protein